MLRTLRIAPLAALAALLLTGNLSASHAASCESTLKARYACSASFDDGGSAEYCLSLDAGVPGDGKFVLYEAGSPTFYCTCQAKGKVPNPRFGSSSRDFFCASDYIALAGKTSSTRITGHGYGVAIFPGLRSSFTCRAVASCP